MNIKNESFNIAVKMLKERYANSQMLTISHKLNHNKDKMFPCVFFKLNNHSHNRCDKVTDKSARKILLKKEGRFYFYKRDT